MTQMLAMMINTFYGGGSVGILNFFIFMILAVFVSGLMVGRTPELLTASIKEIAAKNYSQRMQYKWKNEFGELADSFNTMAEKLEEYNNSNLSKILVEKMRIETLINNMHEPVIDLDENKTVLFINNQALKISGLSPDDIIGKSAQDIALNNDLVRSLFNEMPQTEKIEITPSGPLKIYADNKESYFEKEVVNITIKPTGSGKKG